MKVSTLRIIFLLSVLVAVLLPASALEAQENVVKPGYKDNYYSAESSNLSAIIKKYIEEAAKRQIDGDIKALIVPNDNLFHAGASMGNIYKQVLDEEFEKIVIIAGSESHTPGKLSVPKASLFSTPLGVLKVDKSAVSRLLNRYPDRVMSSDKYFRKNSNLGVQLPFVYYGFKGTRILPLIINQEDNEIAFILSKILGDLLKDTHSLVIGASNSCYGYCYSRAKISDALLQKRVTQLSASKLYSEIKNNKVRIKSPAVYLTAIRTAKLLFADTAKIIGSSYSGELTGDYSDVEGYLSAVLYEKDKKKKSRQKRRWVLNKRERKFLKLLTLNEVNLQLNGESIMEAAVKVPPRFFKGYGVYVSLIRNDSVVANVGSFKPLKSLYKNIPEMTKAVAFHNLSCHPVTKRTLEQTDLRFSVITSKRDLKSVSQIEIGQDGVYLESAQGVRGIILPYIAEKEGWNANGFLENVCLKAGLSPSCWKKDNTNVSVFRVTNYTVSLADLKQYNPNE